jgi:hypothetical protein
MHHDMACDEFISNYGAIAQHDAAMRKGGNNRVVGDQDQGGAGIAVAAQ